MIGCPVRSRDWIIEAWFDHIYRAVLEADLSRDDVGFVFVGDHANDETINAIADRVTLEKTQTVLVHHPSPVGAYRRNWGIERLAEMVDIRNILLHQVREAQPDYFWSVDSDILVAPHSLEMALDAIKSYAAVGSRCYMRETGTSAPSYGLLTRQGGLHRPDAEGCFKVDVIMAMKLMSPAAYNTDYSLHPQGEDIGWSINVAAKGLKLGYDARTTSKHVMSPEAFVRVDARCGY